MTSTPLTTLGIFTGAMTAVATNHWLVAWIGLETNMLAMLMLIAKPKTSRSLEATTKYFLIQAIASVLILISSTVNVWNSGTWNLTQLYNSHSAMTMTIALATKMGAAPTHFWLPEVMQGSSLTSALLMSTWQKIAPTVLMYTTVKNMPPSALMTIGLLSILVGGMGGINQTQLRKMMAYSSISNTGWTTLMMTATPNIALLNMLLYINITYPAFMIMIHHSTKTLLDLSTMWTLTPALPFAMAFLALSTSGLPPLTGFAPKLLALKNFVEQELLVMATIATLLSLVSLLFYLRVTHLSMMLTPPTSITTTTKWRFNHHQPTTTALFIPTALTMTLMGPMIPH
uniref:NADH-ubiquinone oxidoreductase chain 2 n=1 Tax=Pseudotrapelus sinaitus TaxID=118229 RepID=Q9G5Y1_9SAUR|nr:NADH dehydrogenase subunit 2 [Pseudotrapelus sinaitus]